MCYQTQLATAKSASAIINDQFGTHLRKLSRADMFCAPATKRPGFKPLKVPLGANHLTCYRTDGAMIDATRRIVDQLELTSFKGLRPRYLCMPTFKFESK